jgi:MFS family permease
VDPPRRGDPGRLVVSAVGLGLLTRAGSAVELAVGLTLTGLGGAFIWVPAPGLAGSVVRPSRRGAAIGVAGSGIGAGIVFASALAAVLHAQGGDASWRTGLPGGDRHRVVAVVACLFLLRPAPHRQDAEPVRPGALRRVPGWVG